MGKILEHLDNGHQQTLLNLFRCYDLSGDQCEYMVDLIDTTIEMFASKKTDPQPQITAAMQHNNWGDDYGEVYGTDTDPHSAGEPDPKALIATSTRGAPNVTSDTPSSSSTDKASFIAELPGARGASTVASRKPSANAKAITRDIVGASQLALWIDDQGELFQWISNAINALDTKITAHEQNYGHIKNR